MEKTYFSLTAWFGVPGDKSNGKTNHRTLRMVPDAKRLQGVQARQDKRTKDTGGKRYKQAKRRNEQVAPGYKAIRSKDSIPFQGHGSHAESLCQTRRTGRGATRTVRWIIRNPELNLRDIYNMQKRIISIHLKNYVHFNISKRSRVKKFFLYAFCS